MERKWHPVDDQSSQRKQKVRCNRWHVTANTPATVGCACDYCKAIGDGDRKRCYYHNSALIARRLITIIAAIACFVLLFFSLMLVIVQPSAVRAEVSGKYVVIKETSTLPVTITPDATSSSIPSATSSSTPSPTPSPTSSPTPDPTPSPTSDPTPSPTPKPTAEPTQAPTPSPTPSPLPTATATATSAATATAQPTATVTAQPTATLQPTATQAPNANTTPTPILANQNTGSGGPGTPSAIPTIQSGGGSFPVFPVIIGLVVSLVVVGVGALSFVVLRQRVLPTDPSKTNLPPSGARPWSRLRQVSMHGNTNLHNDQTLANNTFNVNSASPFGNATSWATQMNGPVQGMNYAQSPDGFNPPQGFPPQGPLSPQSQPYRSVQPNSGLPPSQNYPPQNYPPQNYPSQQGFPPAQPNAGFYPSNMGNSDIALMLDSSATFTMDAGNRLKRKPSPIRLRWMDGENSDSLASNAKVTNIGISSSTDAMPTMPNTPQLDLERISEELPSLNDPYLSDTLKRYIQKGKRAQDGEQSDGT